LHLLAKNHPEKVFDFFGERLASTASREGEEGYEEVPFHFFGLEKAFTGIADYAVDGARTWFASGDPLFRFRGGRLLMSSLPTFPEAFSRKLLCYVQIGNRDDIEFAIGVMASFHGEVFLNSTCKEVVRVLPAGDPLIEVEVILQSTGVVSGEFGFANAYARMKQEMADWLTDAASHVRAFAEGYYAFSTGGSPRSNDAAKRISKCASACMMIPATRRRTVITGVFVTLRACPRPLRTNTQTKHQNLAKRLARERAARVIAGAGQFPVRYQWPSANTNFGRARKVNQTPVNDSSTDSEDRVTVAKRGLYPLDPVGQELERG
jgi:hypothetical protein